MYGTWNGEARLNFANGDTLSGPLKLYIAKEGIQVYLAETGLPSTLVQLEPDRIEFTATYSLVPIRCAGTRTGTRMAGTASAQGYGGGTWSAVKAP